MSRKFFNDIFTFQIDWHLQWQIKAEFNFSFILRDGSHFGRHKQAKCEDDMQ